MNQVQSERTGQQPLVLVVDDNPAIRDMVAWALELDGYEPAEAAEGQEALDWISNAQREGRHPAVILLDMAMPGMDGPTFLTHLHARWEAAFPLPAVVVITAGTRPTDASSLGVNKVIIKPFHVRDLLDVIRGFIS